MEGSNYGFPPCSERPMVNENRFPSLPSGCVSRTHVLLRSKNEKESGSKYSVNAMTQN